MAGALQPALRAVRHVALGSVAQQILSLVALLTIARSLGVGGYGSVATLIATATTVFNWSTQWATPYMVRAGSVEFSTKHSIGKQFIVPAVIAIGFALLALLVIGKVPQFESLLSFDLVVLASCGMFAYHLARLALQVQYRFRAYGWLLISERVVFVLLLLLGSWLLGMTAQRAQVAYGLSMLAAGLFFLVAMVGSRVSWSGSQFAFNEYLQSVLPVSLAIGLQYLSSQPFVVLLAHKVDGAMGAGWIGMGYVIMGVCLQPFGWIAPTLLPTLSVQIDKDKQLVSSYVRLFVLPVAGCLAALIVALVTAIQVLPQITMLLGPGFVDGRSSIALIILLCVPEAANALLVQVLYAERRESVILMATMAKAVPLVVGIATSCSIKTDLILLNIGAWIAIAIFLSALRKHLGQSTVAPFAFLALVALFSSLGLYYGWLIALLGCIGVATIQVPSFARQLSANLAHFHVKSTR